MNKKNSSPEWMGTVYNQLRELAEFAVAREQPGHSLQPTLILNDAYLKLVEQKNVSMNDRSQVMAVGATIIRRLLVDYARRRKAQRRGGEQGRGQELQIFIGNDANYDVVELHDALEVLSERNSRAGEVVELKYFGGLSVAEIAEHLSVSERTVANDWRFAKAWLYQRLADDQSR